MAVGGVLYVDLLALPPPSKQVKSWVLRQVRCVTRHKGSALGYQAYDCRGNSTISRWWSGKWLRQVR